MLSRSVVSNSLWSNELQHTSLPCPSHAPGACSDSCPLSQWCHPTSHPLSSPIPALRLSQHQSLFQWVGSSHQVANVLELQHPIQQTILPVNIQRWFSLGLTGLILLSKGLSNFPCAHLQPNPLFNSQYWPPLICLTGKCPKQETVRDQGPRVRLLRPWLSKSAVPKVCSKDLCGTPDVFRLSFLIASSIFFIEFNQNHVSQQIVY